VPLRRMMISAALDVRAYALVGKDLEQ
jgi:hypothetical protein